MRGQRAEGRGQRVVLLAWVLLGLSCVGPEAPDVAICRDVIQRLCNPPRCSSTSVLNIDTACDITLQQRTGCDNDDFAFSAPTRDRVLECRVGLVRAGTNTSTHPDCLDVDTMLTECPDVTRWLQGVRP